VTISLCYRGGLQCEVTHGGSQAILITDAAPETGGEGRSFSSTDLVATALGTCVLTAMGAAARACSVDVDGATARVDMRLGVRPRRILALSVHVDISKKVDAAAQAKIERAALACPVRPSLHPDIAVTLSFSWA